MFAERQLRGIGPIFHELNRHPNDGLLNGPGIYGLNLSALIWAILLICTALVWMYKLRHSPLAQVVAAILGILIGARFGLS